MVTLKRLTLLAIAALALSGCAPGEGAPPESESSPGTSSAPSTERTEKPDDGDEGEPASLVLPDNCSELVPIEWFQTELDSSFQEIPHDPSGGDPIAAEFTARGGLACLWGIPQSDAGVWLVVAERAAASDAELVDEWRSAGLQECPPFLDACWFDAEETMLGDYVTVHALVEGYELRAEGFGDQPDPYMSLMRQATDSMGYR